MAWPARVTENNAVSHCDTLKIHVEIFAVTTCDSSLLFQRPALETTLTLN